MTDKLFQEIPMQMNTSQDVSSDVQKFIRQAHSLVGTIFEAGQEIYVNRAPGRLDLMGGNDDYTGGMVFETTIPEATFFAAQSRSDAHFILHNPSVKAIGWQETLEFNLTDFSGKDTVRSLEEVRAWINADPKKSWFAYILGSLYFLRMHFPEKTQHGLNLFMDSEIPLGKGVSSSAALEVSSLKACAAAYGIEAKGIELAEWTQWIENSIAQSASGVMDQFAVIMGDRDSFTPMLCQPCIPYPLVRLPQGLRIWGLDSGIRHSVAGIEYEAARAATFMGYQLICEWENLPVTRETSGVLERFTDPRWQGYLARLSPSLFRGNYEYRLPVTLKGAEFNQSHKTHYDPYTSVRPEVAYPVRLATRYAVEENNRVQLFCEVLNSVTAPVSNHSLELLGELMYGAHAGYSDCGLGSPETDLLVSLVRQEAGNDLFGAKITGGGAGGTVAVLGRDTSRAQMAFARVVSAYREQTGIDPYIFDGSSQGADAFGILKI
jgi:L-arabinokinase